MARAIKRFGLLLMVLIALPIYSGAEQKNPEQSSELHFLILQENGNPIRNASVVLHHLDKKGRQRDGLQLKTDSHGRASIEGIAYGKWRVQVVAQGTQTFGEDYDVHEPSLELKIELKPPQKQVSIY